ncbi:polysaccharide deacetylase family protein [bacterium]|nr:polysaccharide deacetylase family protein [bacterium]
MIPRLFERLFPQWLWRLPVGQKRIALTFDDGPDSSTTPALLALLKELELPATFFLLGENVAANAAIFKDAEPHEHTFAVHGFHHMNHGFYSRRALRYSIQKTEDVMRTSDLQPIKLFRPPYGIFNPFQTSELKHIGYSGVIWTAHVRDWRPQPTQTLETRMRRAFRDGSIVLLHDGSNSQIQAVMKILPRFVENAREHGFQFISLSDKILQRIG